MATLINPLVSTAALHVRPGIPAKQGVATQEPPQPPPTTVPVSLSDGTARLLHVGQAHQGLSVPLSLSFNLAVVPVCTPSEMFMVAS